MSALHVISAAASAFCFGYPFAMTWYWITGGLFYGFFRERHDPMSSDPPPLPRYPGVSILIPCHNEEERIEETLAALEVLDYPEFEIVVVNDGSKDGTGPLLDRLAAGSTRMRVVHLSTNQGKSTALNAAALAARHEYLVCIDSDALLDRHALSWFMFSFLGDETLGALTGNPRIRNRGSLLGQIQVGEFSSIVGLIKRAQTMYGRLFTVSGVVCAFRKRALQDAGWWTRETITDDVDATWKIQLAGWRVAFASSALCWILMPETLKGLWHQRLRWSQGGTQALLNSTGLMFRNRRWGMVPLWLNYWAGILWAYTVALGVTVRVVHLIHPAWTAGLTGYSLFPQWSGMLLVCTYLAQATVSLLLDRRFEKDMTSALFWQIWYPLAYWTLQTMTAIVGLPRGAATADPTTRRLDQPGPGDGMKPRPPQTHTIWPPLVYPPYLSKWVQFRDTLITFLAWVMMAWLIRYELAVLIDYFRPPVFQLTRVSVPNWEKFWDMFGGFIILSVVLAGWIAVFAIRRRRIVYSAPTAPEPAALKLEAHARFWGLSPDRVTADRQAKTIRADFDEEGRLIAFEPKTK